MKCPNCGSEIMKNSKFCQFCGSSITGQMLKEQEQLNKAGCPKCGSSNITFSREKIGEIRGKRGTAIVRATTGFCKDCGYTWQTDSEMPTKKTKKRKTWLWVLGWILVFPLPLTILLLRRKNMSSVIKYGIIAVAWIIYLLIVLSGTSNNTNSVSNEDASAVSITSESQSNLQISNSIESNDAVSTVFAEDYVVNRFISEFNNSQYEITKITKGNIRTKYYGYANDRRIEMINANEAAANAFCISIYGGKDDASKQSMYEVFREAAKTLDSSVTDEDINSVLLYFDEKDVLISNYHVGNSLTVTYVPIKEISTGVNACRIDISCSDYK